MKISQNVLGGGGYFFDSHCILMNGDLVRGHASKSSMNIGIHLVFSNWTVSVTCFDTVLLILSQKEHFTAAATAAAAADDDDVKADDNGLLCVQRVFSRVARICKVSLTL